MTQNLIDQNMFVQNRPNFEKCALHEKLQARVLKSPHYLYHPYLHHTHHHHHHYHHHHQPAPTPTPRVHSITNLGNAPSARSASSAIVFNLPKNSNDDDVRSDNKGSQPNFPVIKAETSGDTAKSKVSSKMSTTATNTDSTEIMPSKGKQLDSKPHPTALLNKTSRESLLSALPIDYSEGSSTSSSSINSLSNNVNNIGTTTTTTTNTPTTNEQAPLSYGSQTFTPTIDLIKTAVSVREVSKQISKTVVTIDNPSSVMIVSKHAKEQMDKALELAEWLVTTTFKNRNTDGSGSQYPDTYDEQPEEIGNGKLVVYIEDKVAEERKSKFQRICQRNPESASRIKFWTPEMCANRSSDMFDFVLTLGGDGTVLYTSWLFQKTVPAIIPFHLGSLGFLTVFDFNHARKILTQSLTKGIRINLRMRFTCTVYRLIDADDMKSANLLNGASSRQGKFDAATRKGEASSLSSPFRITCTNHNSLEDNGIDPASLHDTCPPMIPLLSNHPSSPSSSLLSSSPPENNNGNVIKESPQELLTRTLSEASIISNHSNSISNTASANSHNPSLLNQPKVNDSPDQDSDIGTPIRRIPTCYESEWEDMPLEFRNEVHKVWRRGETFQVLNELVVDRGPSPYMSMLEIYGNGNLLTTVQADGLVLSTPTGSTAYSLAAGGSLVHPEIPAILVTPICPHTLSFRPMLLPDSMVIRVVVPPDSRGSAWASFDGRNRIELQQGDHIQITASQFPLPTVCANQSQSKDWFLSLSRCLSWNERKRQKQFEPAFSRPAKTSSTSGDKASALSSLLNRASLDDSILNEPNTDMSDTTESDSDDDMAAIVRDID